MKKLLLSAIAIITLLFIQESNAQTKKGLFFSLNGGYNLGTSKEIGWDVNVIETSTNAYKVENVSLSLGKGINVGGAIGYMFNKNIGAELGVNYLIGGKTTSKSTYFDGDSTEENFFSKMLQIKPTLIISAGMGKINPYAKFGLLIGKGSINNEASGVSSGERFVGKYKLDGGIAIGFHAGIGLLCSLNSKMALFGELNMINMSYAPTKGKLTEYNVGGENQLIDADVNFTDVEYVDSINSNDVIPSSSPRKQLKKSSPFGSFGLNVGLRYSL